ncbi:zinc finger CCCH domain-containing protein 18 [Drosophila willistoni]|uniref:zinc finger CCCH domain-containing protein 18 n=1 Tax=Drosophila willistoni TaxID=7260 RepID=UPI001F07ED92|nr:zinc finger CCCH domain-containing protein 18 [Drosophila willistoni]XP_046866778.1 zinc finger CCCH domain-containing protein 18 [Drosophila willistoni]
MNMSSSEKECPIGSPSQPSCSNDNAVSCTKSTKLRAPCVESNTNQNLTHDVSMMRSKSPNKKKKYVDDTHALATGKELQMQAFSNNEVDAICKKDGHPDILDVSTKENLNLNMNVQDAKREDGEQPQTLLKKKDILINIKGEIISSDKNKSENTTEIAQSINIKDDPTLNEDGSQNNVNVKKEHFELEQETMYKVEEIDECAENSERLTFIKSEVKENARECGEYGIVAKEELSNQSVKEELEDGEVSADDENDKSTATSLDTQNICRFFLRKACTWGSKCRFEHPTSKDYGNYVMFEKKELPVSFPPVVYSPAWAAYSSNITTSLENSFDSNLLSVKQMMQKAGYFPPTLNRKFQESPAMTFSFNNSAYYYPQNQPSSPGERVTLLPTPSTSVSEIKIPRASTPLRKSRSPKLLPNHHQKAADERMPSKSRNSKRKSRRSRSSSSSSSSISSSESSSDPQASGRSHQRKSRYFTSKSMKTRCQRSHIRGPRTPSLSPPRASARNVINAPRKRRLISSSSSSSKDSSSTSYDLSTYNSSSSECNKNRRKTKKKTSSRKSSARASAGKSKKKDGWKSGRSKKSRQEYLLMKLLLVEDQIAKRRNMQ